MPQASDELREQWGEDGGAGEGKAMDYLASRGFRMTTNWCWVEPEGHEMTPDDWGAIGFLIDEWDMGSLYRLECPNGPPPTLVPERK